MKSSLSFLLLLHSVAAQTLPDRWPEQELKRYLALQSGGGFDWEERKRIEPQRSATSSKAMTAGTSEPLAVHAGLEVLRHGGNAADAALTTALAQVALTAGAAISYAGILTAVYYDAASGKVYTLNASYNTVQNERDCAWSFCHLLWGRRPHPRATAWSPGCVAASHRLGAPSGPCASGSNFPVIRDRMSYVCDLSDSS